MTQTELSALQTMARSKYKLSSGDVRDALAAAGHDLRYLALIPLADAQAACKKFADKYHTLFKVKIRD